MAMYDKKKIKELLQESYRQEVVSKFTLEALKEEVERCNINELHILIVNNLMEASIEQVNPEKSN